MPALGSSPDWGKLRIARHHGMKSQGVGTGYGNLPLQPCAWRLCYTVLVQAKEGSTLVASDGTLKAIIHIGMPKCGSTTIQEFLWVNRDELEEQSFRYDRLVPAFSSQCEIAIAGLVGCGNEIPNNNAMRKVLGLHTMADHKAYVQRYRAYLEEERPKWKESFFLGSAEHILPWIQRAGQAASLDAFLRQYFGDVSYLCYIRRQEALLTSSYSERLKRGERISFGKHFAQRSVHNMNRIAKIWETAVGRRRITFRILEQDSLYKGDLVQDYCALCGIDFDKVEIPPRQNESLSKSAANLLYVANQFLPAFKKNGKVPFARRLIRDRLQTLSQGKPSMTISARQIADIRQANKDHNERLRARHFPERTELFPLPGTPTYRDGVKRRTCDIPDNFTLFPKRRKRRKKRAQALGALDKGQKPTSGTGAAVNRKRENGAP